MRNRRSKIKTILVAMFATGFLIADIAYSQSRKVTVQASGSVDAKTDQLVFSVNLSKYSDSARKAREGFEEMKKEFLSTFNVMKFKGLSVRSTNKIPATQSQPSFGGPMMGPGGGMAPPIAFGGGGGGGGPRAAEPQFYAMETFQLTVDGIDKMSAEALEAQVAEFGKELKRLKLTAAGGFTTQLKSQSEAMKKAFAKAMQKAKDKASVLAALSESRIGKVMEITDNSSYVQPSYNPYNFGMVGMPSMPYQPAVTGMGISSTRTVVASLRVTFELAD